MRAEVDERLHLHLDAFGGIAGDMFLAAILDARPELVEPARKLASGIAPGLELLREKASDDGLCGTRVSYHVPVGRHGPRHYPDYVEVLTRAAPDEATAVGARAILFRLAEAEAKVHGVPLDCVHFHEIADWDSVADVLLAAWAIGRLGVGSVSASPLPLGSGRIKTEHGWMPLPAPATAELLTGMAVIDDGIPGERVTPTGAAILAHLSPAPRLPPVPVRPAASGYGVGHRKLSGIANVLRATLYLRADAGRDVVGVLSFSVDDQTPEDLAVGLERVRAAEGVLDVIQIPAIGKKGRLTARVEVLCVRERVEDVAHVCLAETTSIGLRMREEHRRTLPRETESRDGVRIKTVRRPDGTRTEKAEMDDVALAGDRLSRARRRRRTENGQ